MPGQVRLGFGPQDGLYRRQAERHLADAQPVLERVLGGPTGVIIETATAEEAGPSLADQEAQQAKAREDQLMRDGREAPQVLAALRIFGGRIEQICPLEEDEEQPDFDSSTDDGDDVEG